jgi:glucose/arabinose dehydrogenase
MRQLIVLTRWSAAVVALTFMQAAATSGLQQPGSAKAPALPDAPQVLSTASGSIRVVPIKGFVYPWAMTFAPDGSILVTEQGRNTIRIVRNGVLDATPITGLPIGIQSTRRDTAGVDIALHPRFAENRLVYVAYWKPKPDTTDVKTAVLVRGRFDGGSTLTDVREIFESSSWTDGPGAIRITFGRDGKLYMVIGAPGFADRLGDAAWAQDPGQHGGKVLRLNDDGSAPADNPFVGQPGYKPEIFALGIRNAIGLTIHPETGELWETENGPQGGDEVNIIRRSVNYGWPAITYGRAYAFDVDGRRSGLAPPTIQPPTSAPGMEQPVTFFKPSIAISGMAFYTGDRFPAWKGSLFVGGLAGTQLTRLVFDKNGVEARRETMLRELGQRIRDVKQGPDGLLYLTTDMRDGALLRIEPLPMP